MLKLLNCLFCSLKFLVRLRACARRNYLLVLARPFIARSYITTLFSHISCIASACSSHHIHPVRAVSLCPRNFIIVLFLVRTEFTDYYPNSCSSIAHPRNVSTFLLSRLATRNIIRFAHLFLCNLLSHSHLLFLYFGNSFALFTLLSRVHNSRYLQRRKFVLLKHCCLLHPFNAHIVCTLPAPSAIRSIY